MHVDSIERKAIGKRLDVKKMKWKEIGGTIRKSWRRKLITWRRKLRGRSVGKATGKTSENEGKVWGKLEEMRGNVADEVKSLGRENMGRKLQVSGSLKSKKAAG